MKATAAFLAIVWLCLTPIAAQSYVPDDSDDGSIRHSAIHWSAGDPDRQDVQSRDYGGKVQTKPELVWFTPTVRNADGTLPPPFLTTPLMKSILDAVFNNTAPNGGPPSIFQIILGAVKSAVLTSTSTQDPAKVADPAKADQTAAGQQGGDSAGGAAKDNAAGAIDFCSRYMKNFASDGSNRWNKVRDTIFMPIAILLLLPGAVLAQVKAIAAAGNPVLGSVNPFDGILRSIVAIFLIPGSYLVISFGIDFSNCISFTISDQYTRLFGTNMYKDALCGQLRAMPTNGANAAQGSGPIPQWPQSPDLEDQNFGNGSPDPCGGAPAKKGKVNEAMPAHVVYSRLAIYGANAASTTGWNVLCAFQMAYLCYLFLVGPVVAALWVWPIKQFRDAFPSWIEGVITLCFWSLFWNTTILLMACFKDSGTTGTYIFTALNFLATSCVKYAFDFSGLVAAAGQEAAQKATQPSSGGGSGGAGGKGGKDAAGKPTKTLPPGYHAGSSLGTDGKLHATDGKGGSMTQDPQTHMWVPDSTSTGGGSGGGGAGGDAGGGGGSGGGAGLIANGAGLVKPVSVDHPAPPIGKGPMDVLLGNGDHLRTWTDDKGARQWELLGKDDKTSLAGGVLAPGTINFDTLLGKDQAEKVGLSGASMNIQEDLIASRNASNDAFKDTFTLSIPGSNGSSALTEKAELTPNKDGSEHLKVSETQGTANAQVLLDAESKPGMEYHASNGDTIITSPLGTSGSELVTVVGQDGTNKGTWEVAIPNSGDPPKSIDLGNGQMLTLGSTGNVAYTSEGQQGQPGQTDTWTKTAQGDIQYNGPAGSSLESISLTTNPDGTTTSTETFKNPETNAILGSETEVYTPGTNGSAGTLQTTLFDANGQIGTDVKNANGDVLTLGSPTDIAAGNYQTITQSYDANGYLTSDQKQYTNGVVTSETVNTATATGSDSLQYTNGVLTSDTQISTNAQGQVATTSDVYNADGTQTVTTTQGITFNGSNDTLQAVSQYDNAGNFVSSNGVITDSSGTQVGYVETKANDHGGFTSTEYDMNKHMVSKEDTGRVADIASGHYQAYSDTVTNYDTSGNVVNTTTSYNGQGSSTDNYINGSAVTVSQDGQSVAMISGTHDSVAHTMSSGGGDNFQFQVNGTSGMTSETMSISQNGVVTLTDSSGNQIQGATVVSSDVATGSYVVNDGHGHTLTVNGNERSGFTAQIAQASQPNESFTLNQPGYYHKVTNGPVAPRLTQPAKVMPGRDAKAIAKQPSSLLPQTTAKTPGSGDSDSGKPGDGPNAFAKNGLNDPEGYEGEVTSLDDYSENAEADALYKPGTQSLQRQMMDAGATARTLNSFNSVLGQTTPTNVNTLPDALVAATVDQNMATIMAGQGKYRQAEQLYSSALNIMQAYPQAEEYKILLETYANYLSKRGRENEANEYREKIFALSNFSTINEVAIL